MNSSKYFINKGGSKYSSSDMNSSKYFINKGGNYQDKTPTILPKVLSLEQNGDKKAYNTYISKNGDKYSYIRTFPTYTEPHPEDDQSSVVNWVPNYDNFLGVPGNKGTYLNDNDDYKKNLNINNGLQEDNVVNQNYGILEIDKYDNLQPPLRCESLDLNGINYNATIDERKDTLPSNIDFSKDSIDYIQDKCIKTSLVKYPIALENLFHENEGKDKEKYELSEAPPVASEGAEPVKLNNINILYDNDKYYPYFYCKKKFMDGFTKDANLNSMTKENLESVADGVAGSAQGPWSYLKTAIDVKKTYDQVLKELDSEMGQAIRINNSANKYCLEPYYKAYKHSLLSNSQKNNIKKKIIIQ